jgi:hypothetical protein
MLYDHALMKVDLAQDNVKKEKYNFYEPLF